MKILRYILPLIIFLIIIGFFWQGLKKGDPHKIPSVLIGQAVPEFQANSGSINQNIFRGHVSLLNVWATWCVSCREEHAVLMEIAKTHTVNVYGLNYKDDSTAAKKLLKTYGNPYQAVINDEKGKLAINFGVYGTPETFLIDAKGIIRYKYIGALTMQVWQNEMLPLVKSLERQ